MARKSELAGRHFGRLLVLEREDGYQDGYCLWRCRCDCGSEILVNTKRLTRGTVSHCGCEKLKAAAVSPLPDDLTGLRYGKLTVLRLQNRRENEKSGWLCQCDCGNQCVVTAGSLHSGKRKSCGCLHRETYSTSTEDVTGRRFGRLTALRPVGNGDTWSCRCECGTEVNVSRDSLLSGIYRSCGCIRYEIQENIKWSGTHIDNTCIEILEKRKSRSDNSSGFRGVSKASGGKWLVSIGLQSKRYYIGLYEEFDDAVKARVRSEDALHGGFLEAYQSWSAKAEEDAAWAERNPFYFHVVKNGGAFCIVTPFGESVFDVSVI